MGRHIVCLHRHFFCLRRHLEILGNPRAKKVSRIFKEPVLNYQVFKPFYARLHLLHIDGGRRAVPPDIIKMSDLFIVSPGIII